jgi:glutamate-5-semialdehyde dehydrogenase
MSSVRPQVEKAKAAAPLLRTLGEKEKSEILREMSHKLIQHKAIILRLNRQGLEKGRAMHLSPLMIDRLLLNEERLLQATNLLLRFGSDSRFHDRFRHLYLQIPGAGTQPKVLGLIYESCPYISILSALFALKAGLVVVLRGGKEAFHTNTAIVSILCDVLEDYDLPREILTLLPTTDRVTMAEMVLLDDLIDLIIPQGSEGLLRYVSNNSKIPVYNKETGLMGLCLDDEISDNSAMEYLLPF